MSLTVLKLGGSLITRKSEDKMEVDEETLKRLACEISEAMYEGGMTLVVVHGAGPFGHVLAKEYQLDRGYQSRKQVRGLALTHKSMEALNEKVVSALVDSGVNAIACQPSAGGILDGRKLAEYPVRSVELLLGLGLTPVAYGDVLPDLKTGFNILSGDHLVPYLAGRLRADRVIITTSHNGIYDRSPDDKNAVKYDRVDGDVMAELEKRETDGTDVTGGIARKVRELLTLSEDGIKSEVISGARPGYLKRALMGEEGIGTIIG
ncbi:MAG: hypothetical protein GF416_03445 [Candidatus Altiarchaeales archaeon]|nr:hypothetical protein [Candidatus Altiarchaeales archaeon]MBD3416174.1 hypothetical protein [Candidatus Altiarchaeales archaeon]